MATRLAHLGETVVAPSSSLFWSNFQQLYKGTGKPQDADGPDALQAVYRFAEEMIVPTNPSDLSGRDWRPAYERLKILTYEGAANAAGELHELVQSSHTMAGIEQAGFDLSTGAGITRLYTSECNVAVPHRADSCDACGWETDAMKIYKAMNKVIAEDDWPRLAAVMPAIKKMNFYISETRHPQRRVFSGVSLSGASRSLLRPRRRVRINRYLSTSEERRIASHHCKDLTWDVKGVLLVIDIPENFWGARQISDVSMFGRESDEDEKETVFPPYSQFEVISANLREVRLRAIDKYA